MVVTRDRQRLDTSIDQKLRQHTLHFGLATFEIISPNERLVLLGQLNTTGHKRILGRTIDERRTLQNGRDGKDGRRGHFIVAVLDGRQEVVGGIVHPGENLGVALGIGRPKDDDAVERMGRLEVANVAPDVLEVGLLVGTGDQVVGAVGLVGGDEVGIYVSVYVMRNAK